MSYISSTSSRRPYIHGSQPGDDFSYQTRMVVYNFLGLVPSTPGQDDDIQTQESPNGKIEEFPQRNQAESENQLKNHCGEQGTWKQGSWKDDLRDLPKVSLIDRLNESVAQHEISTALGREIKEKIVPCEPSSGDVGTRVGSVLRDSLSYDGSTTTKPVSSSKEDAQRVLLSELKTMIRQSRSPIDDDGGVVTPITIIQKKNKVKRLSESITSEVSGEGRRYVLSPVPEMLQVPYPSFQSSDPPSTHHGITTYHSSPPFPPPGGDHITPPPPSSTPQGYRVSYSSSSKSSEGSSGRGGGGGGGSYLDYSYNRTSAGSPSYDAGIHHDRSSSSSSNKYDHVCHNRGGSAGGRLETDEGCCEDGPTVFASLREVGMDGDGRVYHSSGSRGIERQMSGASDGGHSITRGAGGGGGAGMDSQLSSISGGVGGGSTRRSTYVDIQEVDNIEMLVKVKALPPISLPLKREISRAITELEGKYQNEDTAEHNISALSSPESDVADSLRVIGDRVQEEYGDQLDEIVGDLLRRAPVALTYGVMQGMSHRLLQHTQHGWTQVALVMLLGQRIVHGLLSQGYSGIGQVVEYTAMMLEDNTADFIINNGGWSSITELGVVDTPVLLPANVLPHLLSPSPSTTPILPPPIDAVDTNHDLARDHSNDTSSRTPTTSLARDIDAVISDEPSKLATSSDDVNLIDSSVSDTADPDLTRQDSVSITDDKISEGHLFALTQLGAIAGLGVIVALAAYVVFKCMK